MPAPSRSSWAAAALVALSITLPLAAAEPGLSDGAQGSLPTDASGNPLNLDFERGTLEDWVAEGDAFTGQPIEGDTVQPRRPGMRSRHAGRFWVGTYEKGRDRPQGTLTSRPFKITKPYARFLVGGGAFPTTRVEIVRQDTKEVIFRASGDDTEDMRPVAVNLTQHLGQEVVIRVVDRHSGGWGHINFDDFRLLATMPVVPTRPRVATPDVYAHDGLSPTEAAAAMTVPPGFSVTLFAGEPDIVQPIAMAIDDRGRLWVAEAYSYPVRVPEDQAKDRILIFEDADGDGRFDTRKVFAERLNLVSGLELGFGGVWVGMAPHLAFIPDRDGDDRPDGPPQVLLDGWGYQDTHETLNSFAWGPDGWLYGCHGVFTHSRVGKPGIPDDQRVPINAGIWRYHPTKHRFEVFAHGTSNPWGIDWDANGQAFITACVIPHLYQVVQGGRYQRQAGPHFNPYTYDDIKTIADHFHYLGATPHSGNGRSDQAGGGHAHAGAMIYLGGRWPDDYRGSLFMNNIHGARLNRDLLVPSGSGFVGRHAPDFLQANDRWSQIVSLKYGPDGDVYLIDWYDKNQCHDKNFNIHDRTNGRIFRVRYQGPRPAPIDVAKHDSVQLVADLGHANQWIVRHARRLLQERAGSLNYAEKARVVVDLQDGMLGDRPESVRLDHLLALHAVGALNEERLERALVVGGPYVRAWAVQLALEDRRPSPALLERFAGLAWGDASPVVRLSLASGLQRIAPEGRWKVLEELARHGEDAGDPNIPLMLWYAAEPLAEVDSSRALRLARDSKIPTLLPFMARRVAAIGTPEAIALLVGAAGRDDDPAVQQVLLRGLNEALKGRRQVAMPEGWPEVYRRLSAGRDGRVRDEATALAVTFGDRAALAAVRGVLADRGADPARRRGALADLLRVHDPELAPTLQSLLADAALRGPALRGLAAYDDPKTPERVLAVYPECSLAEKRDALGSLASRADYARALLAAVGSGRLPANDLTADVVRQLRNLKDPGLAEEIGRVWGRVNDTPADKARQIARYKALLTRRPPQPPDPALGRAIFAKTCQQCHVLFGVGGRVGPDITGSNRADLDYLLSNVLDPSALIGKDYQAHIVSTTGGRVVTGIIRAEDRDAITLLSATETLTIPKAEIEERKLSDKSMMPDDVWNVLSEHEVRSLVAYLAGPAQVPMLATADNVQGFFNGRDLDRWEGDPKLWSVEGGEIVGRTSGLKRNEFLLSDFVAGDFRLRLQVKLVENRGNSGVQFRSEALPEGEVRGYQADIGPGWWGKVYEENGRGLLWKESGEAYLRPGDWNTYEIVARGERIRTYLNGHPCARLDDPDGARRGIIALQLHSGGPTEVRFKDLTLELDPPAEPEPRAGR